MTNEMTNRMRKTTKMIFAMPTAVPAIPPNPRTAAMSAMTRKVIAQDNIMSSFGLRFR